MATALAAFDRHFPATPATTAPDRAGSAAAAPPAVRWLQHPLVWLALCVAAALPLVGPFMPPLTDLGGHLGRYAIQIDGGRSADLRQWYSFDWGIVPNLGVDLLMQWLAPVFGLEPALKAVVIAIPVLQVAGYLLVSRAAHGQVTPLALVALPLAYGYPLHFGFINFGLGAALATLALALWIAMADRRWAVLRWVLFVPIASGLWLCHLAGWALLVLFATADTLMRGRVPGESLLRSALRCIWPVSCLAVPMLARLLTASGPGGHGPMVDILRLDFKLAYLLMPLRDRWMLWDVASALLILAVIYRTWRSDRFARHGGLALGVVTLGVLYVAMPSTILGSCWADMRMVPFLLAMALISARPRPGTDRRTVEALALAGLAFTGARFAGNAVSLALFGRQFEQDVAILERVPRGVMLASLSVEPCHQTYLPWQRERRSHLGGYAIERRHDFSNDQFTLAGGQLLSVHNPAAGSFAKDNSQFTHQQDCGDELVVQRQIPKIPRAFDYLWIIGDGVARPLPGWRVIARSTGSVIYRSLPGR